MPGEPWRPRYPEPRLTHYHPWYRSEETTQRLAGGRQERADTVRPRSLCNCPSFLKKTGIEEKADPNLQGEMLRENLPEDWKIDTVPDSEVTHPAEK